MPISFKVVWSPEASGGTPRVNVCAAPIRIVSRQSVASFVRPRILLAQPSIQPPGGGNAIAAWMIQTLRHEYELHVLLSEPPRLDEVNAYYGTTLDRGDFVLHVVPPQWRRPLRWLRKAPLSISLGLPERKLIMRAMAALEQDFDLVISGSNELQSRHPVIQYVHFPWGFWPRPDAEFRWFHRLPGVLPLYYRVAHAIFPVSREAIRRNRTLANSAWTARHYRQTYGAEAEVLYPPIAGTPPAIPWEERTDDLVVLGRIARGKRLDRAIAVVEKLRRHGRLIGLEIVGSSDDFSYLEELRGMIAERGWISLRLDLTREEILRLVAGHRYGIHAMHEEHFGMAVAEMTLAGCVPFVPSDGGPAEIVADSRLIFDDVDEAVAKISAVLDDVTLREDLRRRIAARAEQFGIEAFTRQLHRIVGEVLAQSSSGPGSRPAS